MGAYIALKKQWMALLAYSRVGFSRKLRRTPIKKGPSAEYPLFPSRRRCEEEV